MGRILLANAVLMLAVAGCGAGPERHDHYTFSYNGDSPREFGGAGADNHELVDGIGKLLNGAQYYFGQEAQYSSESGNFEKFAVAPDDFHVNFPVQLLQAIRTGSAEGGDGATLVGDVVTIQLRRAVIEVIPPAVPGGPSQTQVTHLLYEGPLSAAALRDSAEQLSRLPGNSVLPATIELDWTLTGNLGGQDLALTFKQDLTGHSVVARTDILMPGA